MNKKSFIENLKIAEYSKMSERVLFDLEMYSLHHLQLSVLTINPYN